MPFTHKDFDFIDAHCHFFPPQIFNAIWSYFEQTDENGNTKGWPINYKLKIEEMVKLTQRIQHLKRNRCGPNDLCEEIADVEITLEQLKIMYGIEINCYNYKQSKLRRLKSELKK